VFNSISLAVEDQVFSVVSAWWVTTRFTSQLWVVQSNRSVGNAANLFRDYSGSACNIELFML